MTVCLMVRHGAHDLLGTVLVGRSDTVELSWEGRRQAAEIAGILSGHRVNLLQTSPRRRCRETIGEIASRLHMGPEEVPALDELDYGLWTGRPFSELDCDPEWQAWNKRRDSVRPPRGEWMREVQKRVVRHLQCISVVYPMGCAVLVTHAEVIRAALLWSRSMSLRDYWRFGVEPASIWRVETGRRVRALMGTEMA